MIFFPLASLVVFILLAVFRERTWSRKTCTLAYLAIQILHVLVWAILIYIDFYKELTGKKYCEKGKLGEGDAWIYNKTEYENFDDCHADQDAQIAVSYVIVLAILGFKFFFVYIMYLWFKERVLANSVVGDHK